MENKRSCREDRRMFNYDLVPSLGERDVLSITRDDIEELLEDIIDRGSPRSAEKLLTASRKLFNHVLEQTKKKRWAMSAGRISRRAGLSSRRVAADLFSLPLAPVEIDIYSSSLLEKPRRPWAPRGSRREKSS